MDAARSHLLVLALTAVLLGVVAPPATASEPGPEELLASAEQTMDDARRASEADPILASELYAEAAARYDRLIETQGIDSVALHRAAGNAHLLAGSVGRAVASYLRAERLDPTDQRTRASLAHARARVATAITPGARERSVQTFFWWRGRVPRSVLFGVAVGAFLGFWAIAFARLLGPARIGRAWSGGLALIAIVTFGSLVAEQLVEHATERAVVVGEPATGRTGPSEAVYPESFEQRLSPGVELVVLERRDGWARVRLADGRELWLDGRAIEPV